MKHSTKLHLIRKGWNQQDLIKAESIINKESEHSRKFSRKVFWSSLLVVIIGNIVSAFVLIPFLIFLPKYLFYGLLILLASSIGFLYDLLINDIGDLGKKHHLLASLIFPSLTLINISILIPMANKFILKKELNDPVSSWIIAIIFAIAFISPYFINTFRLYWQKKKSIITK
jgi:hypothetical protein